jgi:phosphoenolpyruvate phosphomutase
MINNKFLNLRNCLTSPDISFLMEAHNPLSAQIVEEVGFEGIWASGLSIAASMGVRDANELSWTQILGLLEYMSDATSIPILVDGDTGYGNFNNVRILVKKLCQRGIAGVCIEDKIFPKTNSFIEGAQSLADIDEFCGKIKAAKDSQTETYFSVVARVEALIAGAGMAEALKRAEAYSKAGADAILIHSKKSTAEEIMHFASQCQENIPLVIVPTKYSSTPTDEYRKAKISTVIWANHNLRASIAAMKNISKLIKKNESVYFTRNEIASLDEVFHLADYDELARAETKYLPNDLMKAA